MTDCVRGLDPLTLEVFREGSCRKRQRRKHQSVPIRNRQTRKVANAKVRNRQPNLYNDRPIITLAFVALGLAVFGAIKCIPSTSKYF